MPLSNRQEGVILRKITWALLAAGMTFAASAAPASAATTGSETFRGAIVTTGVSGTRTVISSVVLAQGVYRGVGRIVEIDNLPTDPDNVSRDDLVFPGGSMHLVSTSLDFISSVNPDTCVAKVEIPQTGRIVGGTGRFAHASGSSSATVRAFAILVRNRDGSCPFDQATLYEVDLVNSTGTLSL